MVEQIRQIFRRGIELVRNGPEWELSSDEQCADPVALATSCGHTPILIEYDYHRENEILPLLVTPSSIFGVDTTSLMGQFLRPDNGRQFLKWKEVIYLLNAVGYHCTNLAISYARIRRQYVRLTRIPGHGDNDHSSFGGASEAVWYEIDALLSAARRTLDISRFVVWQAYGSGPCPRNFHSTLTSCKKMPRDLRERLSIMWDHYGRKLTDYRDCIQHNASLTSGFGEIYLDKRTHGVWLVSAILPDNPDSKSQEHFTYNDRTDVLDYAYQITIEWLEAMKAMAAHIAPPSDLE